jgi:3,4-dihydroxy 2-butanone 4-phosphate synthase/GTP cyclohydrolase II
MSHEKVQRALSAIREGRMVILVDDEDRENEGDLCCAADKITPELINFMALKGRGLICLTMMEERLKELKIPMMVDQNTSPFETAFTVSIEARTGVSTGISAADRARTIQVAVGDESTADDLVRPGHVFPLRAREGGVLVRTGQTEGSVDLARMAGCFPAGVICEIMNEDGTMARMPDLEKFSKEHDTPILAIADLVQYRLTQESLVHPIVSRKVEHPTWGEVELWAFGTRLDGKQHLAVVKGDLFNGPPPLVRVHSGYPFANVFGDLFSNDRGWLNAALDRLAEEERGVMVCIDRGAPATPLDKRIETLGDKRPAATRDNSGVLREYGIGAQILRQLGLNHIRLLTNNPRRLAAIKGFGLEVDEMVPLIQDETKMPTKIHELVPQDQTAGGEG